jgi:Chaperone for flagella basal body P-ring formation
VTARNRLAYRVFALGTVLATSFLAAETGPAAAPTAVTRQGVWQAVIDELRDQGITGRRLPRIEDLELPGSLPRLEGYSLRVTSACWDEPAQRAQFRIECGAPGECLPFFVYLRDDPRDGVLHGNDVDNSGHASVRSGAALCRTAAESHHPVPGALPTSAAAPKSMVRPGDRATAVFLADHLRMTASVTCLDRGREGEIIHVRSQSGQIFRARISGPDLLEALPE